MRQTMLTLKTLASIWQNLLFCNTSLAKPLAVPMLMLAITICGNTSGFAQSFFVDSNPTYLNKDVKITLNESCSDEASEYHVVVYIDPPDGADSFNVPLALDENNDCWTNSFNASIAGMYTFSDVYPNDFSCGKNNNHFDPFTMNVSATPVVLQELYFDNNADFTADDKSTTSANQQYWSPSGSTSALYVNNGGTIAVDADIVICGALPSDKNMTLYGTADDGITTFTMPFVFPANQTTFTLFDIESDQTFGNNFDRINFIDWQIIWDECEADVTSDNNIYYVPPSAPASERIDTVMYVVCGAMFGKPYNDSTALDSIWGAFSGTHVSSADRTDYLYYWKDQQSEKSTTVSLLDPLAECPRSGNCVAWSRFFIDAATLAGVAGGEHPLSLSRVILLPADSSPDIYMKYQDWQTDGSDLFANDDYKYKVPDDVIRRTKRLPDYPAINSIPCQGGAQPFLQFFQMHSVVKIGYSQVISTDPLEFEYVLVGYYDPSYGIKKNTSLELENEEVDGTIESFPNGTFMRRKSDHPDEHFLEVIGAL